MLGRPRENPDAAADRVITFRVTAAEAEALDRRVDAKNAELRKLGFVRRLLTRAAYCRNLLVVDLENAGLLPDGRVERKPQPVKPNKSGPSKRSVPKKRSRKKGRTAWSRVQDPEV